VTGYATGGTVTYPASGQVTLTIEGAPLFAAAQQSLMAEVITDATAIRAAMDDTTDPDQAPAPALHATRLGIDTLSVVSLVGPTLQGQGSSTGRRATILHLGACPLRCSPCTTACTRHDSRYDPSTGPTERPVDELILDINTMGTAYTVLTGDAMGQQHRVGWLQLLINLDGQIEIETAGTIIPSWPALRYAAAFNVHVGLAHVGGRTIDRVRPEALAAYRDTGRARFTFVVSSVWFARELNEVAGIADSCGLPAELIWITPADDMDAGVVPGLQDRVVARGWNYGVRLQVPGAVT
jgi:7-carboxy-7-deazaguanine synthase